MARSWRAHNKRGSPQRPPAARPISRRNKKGWFVLPPLYNILLYLSVSNSNCRFDSSICGVHRKSICVMHSGLTVPASYLLIFAKVCRRPPLLGGCNSEAEVDANTAACPNGGGGSSSSGGARTPPDIAALVCCCKFKVPYQLVVHKRCNMYTRVVLGCF